MHLKKLWDPRDLLICCKKKKKKSFLCVKTPKKEEEKEEQREEEGGEGGWGGGGGALRLHGKTCDLVWGVKEGSHENITFELRLEKWLGVKVKSLGESCIYGKWRAYINIGFWWEGEWTTGRTERVAVLLEMKQRRETATKWDWRARHQLDRGRRGSLSALSRGYWYASCLDNRTRFVTPLFL